MSLLSYTRTQLIGLANFASKRLQPKVFDCVRKLNLSIVPQTHRGCSAGKFSIRPIPVRITSHNASHTGEKCNLKNLVNIPIAHNNISHKDNLTVCYFYAQSVRNKTTCLHDYILHKQNVSSSLGASIMGTSPSSSVAYGGERGTRCVCV